MGVFRIFPSALALGEPRPKPALLSSARLHERKGAELLAARSSPLPDHGRTEVGLRAPSARVCPLLPPARTRESSFFGSSSYHSFPKWGERRACWRADDSARHTASAQRRCRPTESKEGMSYPISLSSRDGEIGSFVVFLPGLPGRRGRSFSPMRTSKGVFGAELLLLLRCLRQRAGESSKLG